MPKHDHFLPGPKQAYGCYLNQLNVNKRYQYEYVKRAEFWHWLKHPEKMVTAASNEVQQQQYNQNNRAKLYLFLWKGQL